MYLVCRLVLENTDHAHAAGGGDFFGARFVVVDLVGDGAGRGRGVGAAVCPYTTLLRSFFDRDRGARFAFTGERGGERGGRRPDRLHLRATPALRFAVA